MKETKIVVNRIIAFMLIVAIFFMGFSFMGEKYATAKHSKKKAVALTFDDGPSRSTTPKALRTLKKYGAHATFFVVGNRVRSGRKYIRRAIKQGCEIASHSWNHSNLAKLTMKKVNRQHNRTVRAVKKYTGYDVKMLRPPYGSISKRMHRKFSYPMIMWSVDTLDWKYRNTASIMRHLRRQVRNGSIILMHDIHRTSVNALPTVLRWLKRHNYEVLTVSELAERKNKTMKDKTYYAFR